MSDFLVQKSAVVRLKEIYRYTVKQWGENQADLYLKGMFDHFDKIAKKQVRWILVPAEFQVSGFYSIYEKHYIYFKELASGKVGIVTVLHERMHQMDRFKEDSINE